MTEIKQSSKSRWYVIHVYSGYEKYVMQALKEQIRQRDLDEKFEDIIVPTEKVIEMRAGQKRKSERKFFPGYVLVKMLMDDETWHLVRHSSKVTGFVGGQKTRPAEVPEAEVLRVTQQMAVGARIIHRPIYAAVGPAVNSRNLQTRASPLGGLIPIFREWEVLVLDAAIFLKGTLCVQHAP